MVNVTKVGLGANGQDKGGGRHPSRVVARGALLARVSNSDDNYVPGDGQRQGERGTCGHATMPDRGSCDQRDRDRDPGVPGKARDLAVHPGATKGDCTCKTQGDQSPGESAKHSTSGDAHVRVRVRASETNNDMAQPSRILDAAKPDEALRILQEQHAAPYEDRQEKRSRQKTCGSAGRRHAGGVAEQERAEAGAFVLMNLFSYRRSAFHVEDYSTLIGAR